MCWDSEGMKPLGDARGGILKGRRKLRGLQHSQKGRKQGKTWGEMVHFRTGVSVFERGGELPPHFPWGGVPWGLGIPSGLPQIVPVPRGVRRRVLHHPARLELPKGIFGDRKGRRSPSSRRGSPSGSLRAPGMRHLLRA